MDHHLVIIGRLPFRVAKTMPHIPHEYAERSQETEAAYVALFNAIQNDGVVERYKGRKKKYLYPGDGWKYWAMTTFLPMSRVINRMKIEDDLERLRQEDPEAAARHCTDSSPRQS
jgi:hypothetical protein